MAAFDLNEFNIQRDDSLSIGPEFHFPIWMMVLPCNEVLERLCRKWLGPEPDEMDLWRDTVLGSTEVSISLIESAIAFKGLILKGWVLSGKRVKSA